MLRKLLFLTLFLFAFTIKIRQTKTVEDTINENGCNTGVFKALSVQLAQCIDVDMATLTETPGVQLSSAAASLPYVQKTTLTYLKKVIEERQKVEPNAILSINSALRTIVQQLALYSWGQAGLCNLGLVGKPSSSNHQYGTAVDINDYSGWKSYMLSQGCTWPYGASDTVHFECPGSRATGASTTAFQKLWNANNPNDQLAVDGVYGANTESRLLKSPIEGFAQPCCSFPCDLDIVILLDSSGSIGSSNFLTAKNFIKNLLKCFQIGESNTRVGILNFGDNVQTITTLKSSLSKSDLYQTIDNIVYLSSSTNTQEALSVANKFLLTEGNGMRPITSGISKVVVVITDGASNVQPEKTLPNANAIKARGISIISVGVGSSLNQRELEGIASGDQNVFNINSYNNIDLIFGTLKKSTCKQPAQIKFQTPISSSVAKDSYKYFAIDLTNTSLRDFTIELKITNGRCDLTFSFTERNPEFTNIVKSVDELKLVRSVTESTILFQVSNSNQSNVLYTSVKGLEESNMFSLYFYNQTVNIKNNSKNILPNFINFLLSSLFIIYIFY